MKLSIGFEFQTNYLSLGFETNGDSVIDPTSIIYHPNILKKVDLKTNSQYTLTVYGDDISQKQDKIMAFQNLRYLANRYHFITLNDTEKIRLDTNYEYLLNDAEFLVTYPNAHDVRLNMLLSYMEMKTKKGMELIEDYLKTNGKLIQIKSVKGSSISSSRPKTENNFLFHSFYRIPKQDENIVFFSKDKNPKLQNLSYYVQVTLGVDIENIWNVMKLLSEQVKNTPKIISSEKNKVAVLEKIENDLDTRFPESNTIQNKLIRVLYLLFVYSFKNQSEYKKSQPFIIRHHFVQLLKLLNKSQFDVMVSWLNTIDLKILANQLYTKPTVFHVRQTQLTEEQDNKYLAQKEVQGTLTVTTYPITPNGLQTIILFEFRYWNAVLNHRISKKKGTHDFITSKELSS